ncbi:MAG: hypothetical protein BYD32DRAFT_414155 [Podila humilis]|nr:MAG: hypothetical protein BYD32DRAFT_414155 [Podila humilis]
MERGSDRRGMRNESMSTLMVFASIWGLCVPCQLTLTVVCYPWKGVGVMVMRR